MQLHVHAASRLAAPARAPYDLAPMPATFYGSTRGSRGFQASEPLNVHGSSVLEHESLKHATYTLASG